MEEKQAFFVESTDGRKFKMVIRGDLGKLSVAKVRRYLKSYGVPENQDLLAGKLVLEDDMLGEQFGLQNDGVLHLRDPASPHRLQPTSASPPPPPSPPQQPPRIVSSPSAGLSSTTRQQQPLSYAPHEAWRAPRDEAPARDVQAMEREMERLRRQADAAEARSADLERQLAESAKAVATASSPPPRGSAVAGGSSSSSRSRGQGGGSAAEDVDGLQVAKASLAGLAQKLQVTLQFDKNLTCVVGTDEDFSILLTYDPATERLYLYSSLLTELPEDLRLRMKLYEVLLEGSLLGREVCGGGIGISTQNSVVVLTTSLPIRHCDAAALCDVLPTFVETLGRWRELVDELLR
ncbi:Tir chaperone protein (CesT) family [Novymonas esmeraldas]|uniref:Tir chaperone protein (CesT) family n=1 Tax=Novymonas esmeraldas TaxID=1808958 RepID=A0AAW0F6X8_9TRYP